uniref:Histidinol dehydrogenase n=1 Tax=Candidatus Kentrum sp. MB TaxID=2138164 RepID=A0A450XT21_9GAMM|nr:MAG: histidinol dehydrogenase [Candidatus Kentron sp. MB]VFK35946.1 MAG: histidinol dehydrogenase [Candidatus Kentron sp. MB]VFK77577.1 MAG: histidinol dehydrogenase [Candidatus Kentron sp. MB]
MQTEAPITRLNTAQVDFEARLEELISFDTEQNQEVERVTRDIVADVRRRGDIALMEYTNRFDRRHITDCAPLFLSSSRLKAAYDAIEKEQRAALETAAGRIRAYHEHQKQVSWQYEEDGVTLGQRVTPLDRVGLYVPGGKAAYPSSVLMNAIPAKVADVREIIMVVPAPYGELNELVLAAAWIAQVDRVITIGGAQAVAALAYGTASVPRVDKIVGPGNAYVAAAKRIVFGTVGIDMVAGPSEILVICDGKTPSDWIAMDLFSQAEHDEDARAILLSPDAGFPDRVEESIRRLLSEMERTDIIRTSLRNRGALIQVKDLEEAAHIANRIAPEHLELSVEEPEALLAKIQHAGAVFLGRHTPEALGDYCAGPNHVLPTSCTARFSSPLGVYDFQKRTSVIGCSPEAASRLGKTAAVLARGEGLEAHARSAALRIKE